MGLRDKLDQNIAAGMNPFEPLFGGLIPRREIIQEEPIQRPVVDSNPPMPRPVNQMTPVRQNGMQKINNNMLNSNDPFGGRDVVFDWTEQKLNLANKELDLQKDKFGYEKERDQKKYGLDVREQERKESKDKNDLSIDKDKQEIDHRKQALDEWKARNPEGEIKTLEDGKIVVIDKRTGASIETGLKADHLSEKEKLAIQHGYRMSEITEREKQQKANAPGKVVNPSQQRTAERDAANELLNDPNYAWLAEKKYVAITPEGVVIKRPKKGGMFGHADKDVDDTNTRIGEFEAEWKKRSEARMNKSFSNGSGPVSSGKTVEMYHGKTGEKLLVPEEELEDAKANGALTAEEYAAKNKPIEVDDNIELFYNDKGKVIGARNRKAPGKSKFEE